MTERCLLVVGLWIDYFRAGVVSTISGMGEDWCVLK